MKITRTRLKKIISEEISRALREDTNGRPHSDEPSFANVEFRTPTSLSSFKSGGQRLKAAILRKLLTYGIAELCPAVDEDSEYASLANHLYDLGEIAVDFHVTPAEADIIFENMSISLTNGQQLDLGAVQKIESDIDDMINGSDALKKDILRWAGILPELVVSDDSLPSPVGRLGDMYLSFQGRFTDSPCPDAIHGRWEDTDQ